MTPGTDRRPVLRGETSRACPAAAEDGALVRRGYQEAARIVRRRAGNFWFAFLGQRRPARRALHAIYAFCREVDDAADDGRGATEAKRSLAALRCRLAEIYEGEPSLARDRALQHAARRFGIARRDFDALLSGVERDLTVLAYATFDDLYAYCFEVAASVGLLCLPVFGRSDPLARRHAVDLGVGMQLTNILRDVAEDGSRGRVYIPRADLARFGISEPDLPRESAGTDGGGDRAPGRPKAREPSGLDALVRFEAARARRFLTSGRRLLPLLEARERFCPAALASIYGALLERIEARGAEALETRVSLPARRKLWLAATSYARARDRSPAGVGDGGAPKQKRRDSHLGESRFDHPRA